MPGRAQLLIPTGQLGPLAGLRTSRSGYCSGRCWPRCSPIVVLRARHRVYRRIEVLEILDRHGIPDVFENGGDR